jgi:hypothetical protein
LEVEGIVGRSVQEYTAAQVYEACREHIHPHVLECLLGVGETGLPARYWVCSEGYVWFDDPTFGDLVRVDKLAYDSELGMYPIEE